MAGKSHQTPCNPKSDIGTDYALIGVGISAALIALIYLILI
jgi:hypothetical protein